MFEAMDHVLLKGKRNCEDLWRILLGMFAIITTIPPDKPIELPENMSKCVSVFEDGWETGHSGNLDRAFRTS